MAHQQTQLLCYTTHYAANKIHLSQDFRVLPFHEGYVQVEGCSLNDCKKVFLMFWLNQILIMTNGLKFSSWEGKMV